MDRPKPNAVGIHVPPAGWSDFGVRNRLTSRNGCDRRRRAISDRDAGRDHDAIAYCGCVTRTSSNAASTMPFVPASVAEKRSRIVRPAYADRSIEADFQLAFRSTGAPYAAKTAVAVAAPTSRTSTRNWSAEVADVSWAKVYRNWSFCPVVAGRSIAGDVAEVSPPST